MVHEPFGAGAQIVFVLRLRGDAGEAEVIAQFRHEAGLVFFQVFDNCFHCFYLKKSNKWWDGGALVPD